jgi:hypothetical protein
MARDSVFVLPLPLVFRKAIKPVPLHASEMPADQELNFSSLTQFAEIRRRKHHAIERFFATTLGRSLNTTFWGTQSY